MVTYNVNLEGKTVLVTGAAGFIGSNLVKRLFKDINSIKVIGIDSITDYYDVNIKYERLKEIEALGCDWQFYQTSIADRTSLENIFTENKISVVDVPVTFADTTPLEEDFGFRPSPSLRDGLRVFAEWYAKYY